MSNPHIEATKIFIEIGNYIHKNKKISEYFFEEVDLWNCLLMSFKLYFNDMSNIKNKKYLFKIKKYMDYNSFKRNITIKKTDILFTNPYLHRSNKGEFSNYYNKILPLLTFRVTEVPYINFQSYFDINSYNAFDYKNRFPLNSFIFNKDIKFEEEKSKKIKKLFLELKNDEKFIKKIKKYTSQKKIMETLEYIFYYTYPESIRLLKPSRRICEKFKPKIIIVVDRDGNNNYILTNMAKKMGIKTIEISHGMTPETLYPKEFVFPDKICIFGKKEKKFLIKAGCPKENIEITGNIRNEKVKEMNKINIDLKRKNMLFLTQGPAFSLKQNSLIIKPIFEWIKKNPEWNLTIKLHPDDRYYLLYWFYSLKYGIKTKIIKNTDLSKLIDDSDIVITKNSTAGIECVAKYKPVLVEWIDSEKYFKLFNEYFDTEFYDLKTLDEQIKKVISPNFFEKYKKQRKNFLDDYSAGYGTAPEKIAKIIKEMLLDK